MAGPQPPDHDHFAQMESDIWQGAEPVSPAPHEIAMALDQFRELAQQLAQLMGDMAGMITERLDKLEASVGELSKAATTQPVPDATPPTTPPIQQ